MHESLKQAVGISCANCKTCTYLDGDSDEYDYNVTRFVCANPSRKRVSNLTTFPFKSEQKCWSPDFWQSVYADKIKTGEDEEVDYLYSCFINVQKKLSERR
jgi:hypothetical protein